MSNEMVAQPAAMAPAAQNYDAVEHDTAPRQSGLAGRFAALSMRRKLLLAGALAALIAIVASLLMLSSQSKYKVLYANLADKDGGAVVAQLAQMDVPYKLAEGSSAILVPGDRVHEVRLKLAAAGLPKGSVVGFELMDNARFGLTQFQERLTFQRGLEGELIRTITALAAVQDARVHLALPNQNGFFRAQQKPSASVMLTLHPGLVLDRAQIAGIVHLVSSSVPELDPKNVSVLDQKGTLLSATTEGDSGGLDTQQLRYTNQIESLYAQRIYDILEPVVGRGNLRAQVAAQIDFSQSQSTAEEFRPNQDIHQAAVRSHRQSSTPASGLSQQPAGVPGAASNQPPQPASAPINGPAQALQAAQGNNGTADAHAQNTESVTNYEVDKTVRVTRSASGAIKRLSAAVVVNHKVVVDADGKSSYAPLSEAELAKLTALVRESMGFDAARGDSVQVVDAPFLVEATESIEPSFWQQSELMALARSAIIPGVLALLALILIFAVVRPTLRTVLVPARQARALNAIVNDETPLLPGTGDSRQAALSVMGAAPTDLRLEAARNLAQDNPSAVANIVRGWVSQGQA